MIRTVLERLPKVSPGASYFIEVHDERLLFKHWERGALKTERWLRATALPVGTYEVLDGEVVHLHDPATLIDELRAAQLGRRGQSPEFREVVKRIATATGGRVQGNHIALKASARVDLDRLQKSFAEDAAIVYFGGRLHFQKRELHVICADSPLDALKRTSPPELGIPLFTKLDALCGIAGINFHDDDGEFYQVGLRLVRAPVNPAAVVREIMKAEVSLPMDLVNRYEREWDERGEDDERPAHDDPKKETAAYYRKQLGSSLELELQWGEPDF